MGLYLFWKHKNYWGAAFTSNASIYTWLVGLEAIYSMEPLTTSAIISVRVRNATFILCSMHHVNDCGGCLGRTKLAFRMARYVTVAAHISIAVILINPLSKLPAMYYLGSTLNIGVAATLVVCEITNAVIIWRRRFVVAVEPNAV